MKDRANTRRIERAFTLIELLVVISIIGLLLAILIPGLSLAQEAARELICKTQLEQLFKGAFYYAEIEDSRRLPYFGWLSGRPPAYRKDWWPTQVAKGMEVFEPEIYTCPSDPKPYRKIQVRRVGGHIEMASGTVLPLSYRGPCDTLEWRISLQQYWPKRITDWEQPDRAIMLVEGWANTDTDRECFRAFNHMGIITFLPDLLPTWQRHSGFSNILTMDGHIDRYTPEEAERLAMRQETKFGLNVSP